MKHVTVAAFLAVLLGGCTGTPMQPPAKPLVTVGQPPAGYMYVTCMRQECWNWNTGEYLGINEDAKDGQYLVWALDQDPVTKN